MTKKTVVIGLLGTTLDRAGESSKRWERWRPSVAACQHEDLVIDRFELLHQKRYSKLASQVADDIHSVSPETTLNSQCIEFRDAWDFQDVYEALLEFALSYPFDTDNENYLVHIATGTHVAQICLFLLTEARYIPAKLLQSSPPRGRKNSGVESIAGTHRTIDLDLARYDRLAQRFTQQQRDGVDTLKSGIATRNVVFNQLIERIEKVAINSSAPVLVTGPTGAGKSQLASRIYSLKKQRHQLQGKLVEVNCATLRGDTAMSTIFGHQKGAYTGANKDRPGLLRAADNGLLFLDEIGELGLDEQAMLLRALEEKRFLPVGADAEVSSNFQLIAGTNRDLHTEVQAGNFREDLLARLNLWTFQLPGLNQRREDIEPNVDYELERIMASENRFVRFSQEARSSYLTYATSPAAKWTANFRDLSGSITRMATLAPGGRIGKAEVQDEITTLQSRWQRNSGESFPLVSATLGEQADSLDLFEKPQLEKVLEVCREANSLSSAGRTLFALSRLEKKQPNDADRLKKYLAKYSLSWADVSQ